jgi:hypothetical protein
MNKRIQELAEQSGSTHKQSLGVYQFYSDELDKFAQLIVADCVKIVEGYCETSPEIYGLPLDILEHFDMELPE